MDIERKVRAVKREIVSQNPFEHPATSAADGLQSRPEKAVMDNQEIHSVLDRALDSPKRCIHCRADLRDRAGVFHLETVERIRPVLDFTNAQMRICVGNNLRKSRHARHCGEGT